MQDRYAGDVGDFLKLGVLRALAGSVGEDLLRVGINWYLVDDELHNDDGKHISYLTSQQPTSRHLRSCDLPLASALHSVVHDDPPRSVRAIELSGALPPGCETFSERIPPGRRSADRAAWHARACAALRASDVVFLDPDNGMRSNSVAGSGTDHKHAFTDEIHGYWLQNQSVVVYHHADRSAPAEVQMERLLDLLRNHGVEADAVLRCRRGSTRFFVVAPAPSHRDLLMHRLLGVAEGWRPHIEIHLADQSRGA